MFSAKSIFTLLPWLSHVICFSPDPPALLPWRPSAAARPDAAAKPKLGLRQTYQPSRSGVRRGGSAVIRSQSVNDEVSGFHYEQEPRGTSFISQVSRRDLRDRRRAKRWAPPSVVPVTPRAPRRPAPDGGRTLDRRRDGIEHDADDDEGYGFDEFKENVSANLGAMTDLLKAMHGSQSMQNDDVRALSRKVADMADRIAEDRGIEPSPPGRAENKNFGTSLDGEFNRKIKDVIDEFDMVAKNHGGVASGERGGGYQGAEFARLEARIAEIDEVLRATEEKFDAQMEYVDAVVGQRWGGVDDASFDGVRFQQRPPMEPFLEEGPPPPPLEELPPWPPPPPPPPPPGNYDNPYYVDDGTRYHQERNYVEPDVPPPRMREISSSQKAQSGQSVNERSGGHHYGERNSSFMSAFSKADNEDRRRFEPLWDPRRDGMPAGDRPPRGAPPRDGFAFPPMEPMPPEYFDEPHFYEDGPLMEEDYFYDDMYEF